MRIIYILFLFSFSFAQAQTREIDSLKNLLSQASVDTTKLQILSDLNWASIMPDALLSKQYAVQELSLATKIGHRRFIAQAYNDMGSSFIRLGMPDSALDVLNRSLAIRRSFNDNALLASSLSKIAMVQHTLGNYQAALKIEFEALKTYENLGNTVNESRTLNNISATYQQLNNPAKAIEYLDKAIVIYERNKDDSGLASAYFSKGNNLLELKKLSEARVYFSKALDGARKVNDKQTESYVYTALGVIEKSLGNSSAALSHFRNAYQLALEESNQLDVILNRQQLISMLIEVKQYGEAEKLAIENASNISPDVKPRLLENYKQLALIYSLTNRGQLAKSYLEKFSVLKDSIYSSEVAVEVANAEKKYETEKKAQENQLLQQENKVKELELQSRNRTILVLAISILLIILIVLWRINAMNLKKKEQALLAAQKLQKEKERISRDLHDNVGGQLSYVLYSMDEILDDDKQKRADLLGKVTESVRSVIGSLRETIWAINDEEISLVDLSDKLKVYARNMFKNASTQLAYSENINQNILLNSTIGLNLYRICQEIINNCFKHAKAAEVRISISTEDKVTISISDNGVGFDTAANFENSYGLSNIEARAKEAGISVRVQSNMDEGTTYTLIV